MAWRGRSVPCLQKASKLLGWTAGITERARLCPRSGQGVNVCRDCEILEDSFDFSESLKEKVDTGWGLKAVRERACLSLPSLLPLIIEASWKASWIFPRSWQAIFFSGNSDSGRHLWWGALGWGTSDISGFQILHSWVWKNKGHLWDEVFQRVSG